MIAEKPERTAEKPIAEQERDVEEIIMHPRRTDRIPKKKHHAKQKKGDVHRKRKEKIKAKLKEALKKRKKKAAEADRIVRPHSRKPAHDKPIAKRTVTVEDFFDPISIAQTVGRARGRIGSSSGQLHSRTFDWNI